MAWKWEQPATCVGHDSWQSLLQPRNAGAIWEIAPQDGTSALQVDSVSTLLLKKSNISKLEIYLQYPNLEGPHKIKNNMQELNWPQY